MATKGSLLEFRPPVRPAGDARLFEDALVTMRAGGGRRRHRAHAHPDDRSLAAVGAVVVAVALILALAAALGLRAVAWGAPPEPAETPALPGFAVHVEGVSDAHTAADGRFVLATITIADDAAAQADADVQKVLREGGELMQKAKHNALAAASACLGRPVSASIDTGGTIGASGGLMFALAIVDELTPGDLTGGRVVAGTGAISEDGRVGPVMSVAGKIRAAEEAGAQLFLVPAEQLAEARGHAHGLRIAGVSTLGDALAALGTGAACAA